MGSEQPKKSAPSPEEALKRALNTPLATSKVKKRKKAKGGKKSK